MIEKSCGCCSGESVSVSTPTVGEYVCYCNKVTEKDIAIAIKEKGAKTVDEAIKLTGAMVNSNCKVNNPKGTCCYSDIVLTFQKYSK